MAFLDEQGLERVWGHVVNYVNENKGTDIPITEERPADLPANSLWFDTDEVIPEEEGVELPDNVTYYGEEEQESSTASINADTLGGRLPEDYALNSEVNNIEETVNNISDYVVEQGTSDIWTYRKWNSGLAECWGCYKTTGTHYSGPHASWFYGYRVEVPYPFTFKSVKSGTFNMKVGSGFCACCNVISDALDSATCLGLSNVNTANSAIEVQLHIFGTWK